jgi:sirohydrochlorin ferrochelatase
MEGILYIAHGSQKGEKNEALRKFVEALHEQVGSQIPYRTAFLEHTAENIENEANALIAQGVDHLIAVPLLLFAATHALKDIPNEIEAVRQKHPEVVFYFADTFGHRAGTGDILRERIETALQAWTKNLSNVQINQESQELKKLPNEGLPAGNSVCIVVSHGTKRYPTPQVQLEQICASLEAQVKIKVLPANIRGHEPFLLLAVDAMKSYDHLIVVPFFMFEGHLVDEITQKLQTAALECNFNGLTITDTLDFDPRMMQDIASVIVESRN